MAEKADFDVLVYFGNVLNLIDSARIYNLQK